MIDNKTLLISGKEIWSKLESISKENGKVCFIFGAGASYGYTNHPKYRPPIVRDLFSEENPIVHKVLEIHEPIRNNLPHLTRQIARHDNDLESYLSELYTGSSDDAIFANILNYLQDIFSLASEDVSPDDNFYMQLINEVTDMNRDKSWSYITFNYDTIFEKSYLTVGRDRVRTSQGFGSMEAYRDVRPLILKMHGSINFRYTFSKTLEQYDQKNPKYNTLNLFTEMMDDSKDTDFGKTIDIIDPRSEKPQFYSTLRAPNASTGVIEYFSKFSLPLMLIPIHASISPENKFFQDMIERAKDEIQEAKIVVAIGYNFGDKAFMNGLSPLDFFGKEIIIVGTKPNPASVTNHKAVQSIRDSWPKAKISLFDGDGFEEFVNRTS